MAHSLTTGERKAILAQWIKSARKRFKVIAHVGYYEMKDGTWQCEDTTYQFRLKLDGRMPNSELDSCFVVLTNNENLTFEEVSKSLYSSSFEDIKVMEGSLIVEMIY